MLVSNSFKQPASESLPPLKVTQAIWASKKMIQNPNPLLTFGALLSGLAALLHLGCIAVGPSGYRFFGAGERMVQMASEGKWQPAIFTFGIAVVLFSWSLYALAGAGIIPNLPATRLVLCAITAVYLVRSAAYPLLRAYIRGNTKVFWLWSSAICFAIGAVHLVGLVQVWAQL